MLLQILWTQIKAHIIFCKELKKELQFGLLLEDD